MSEKLNEIAKGSFLRVNEEGKAYWGQSEGGGGGGAITTLHIDVTAVNMETMEATFTADKTPAEMQQASANGPTWCVVSFAAGIVAEEAVSYGAPPAWYGGTPAFGGVTAFVHDADGDNTISYAVRGDSSDSWLVDVTRFGV